MSIAIRLLGAEDGALLHKVADGVFDGAVVARHARDFLLDPRHHLAVALDGDTVVGMASAVHHVHPDKPPQLWINEVGVADAHQRRGIGLRLVEALVAHGRRLGCTEAWVLADESNDAARRLYEKAGGVAEPGIVMYTFPLAGE